MEGDGGRARARPGAARGRGARASAARRACSRPGSPASSRPTGQPDNPHLTDQVALFESLRLQARRLRPAGRGRDAARRRDDHARRLRRPERARRLGARRVVRRRLRGRPGPARGARAVPPLDPGPARRGARRGPAAVRHRGPPRLLHARGAARASCAACRPRCARASTRYAEGVNAWIARVRRRPVAAPARARAARPHAGAVDAARLGGDRRPARPHGACDDGRELENWRALRALGAKRFARLLPLRQREHAGHGAGVARAASRPSRAAAARDERRATRRRRGS